MNIVRPFAIRCATLAATLLLPTLTASAPAAPAAQKARIAAPAAASAASAAPASAARPARPAKPVDLNSASATELKKLPGIGDALAAKIVAARPFRTKAELVTKGIVTESTYDALRHHVVAAQGKQPLGPGGAPKKN